MYPLNIGIFHSYVGLPEGNPVHVGSQPSVSQDKGIDALSLLYLFEAVASGEAPGIANMPRGRSRHAVGVGVMSYMNLWMVIQYVYFVVLWVDNGWYGN